MITPEQKAASERLQAKNRELLQESFNRKGGEPFRVAAEKPLAARLAEREAKAQPLLPTITPRKISIVLPYPPSANRYWRHAAVLSTKQNRWIATTYLSEEAKEYKENIRLFFARRNLQPMLGNLILTAYVYRPQRSGDLGNRLKVIEDALQEIAYVNDSQICESHHFRREDSAKPRVEILLEEML